MDLDRFLQTQESQEVGEKLAEFEIGDEEGDTVKIGGDEEKKIEEVVPEPLISKDPIYRKGQTLQPEVIEHLDLVLTRKPVKNSSLI